MWAIDNTLPTAPRTLSEPLTSLATGRSSTTSTSASSTCGSTRVDDQPGFVVGELRLNSDGWFNYFGFPDQPLGTPFTFSHSGKVVKALTYGNLGTGGLSKAAFEQIAGVRIRAGLRHALDRAPGDRRRRQHRHAGPVQGDRDPRRVARLHDDDHRQAQERPDVESGVTCIAGATINGPVTVEPGASLVVSDGSQAQRGLPAVDAAVVHVFGADVNRDSQHLRDDR